MLVKCRIQKYDPEVLKSPYKFITLVDCVEIDKPENDPDGTKFFTNAMIKCDELGYELRFYSLCSDDPNIDFSIVVMGELEDILGIY